MKTYIISNKSVRLFFYLIIVIAFLFPSKILLDNVGIQIDNLVYGLFALFLSIALCLTKLRSIYALYAVIVLLIVLVKQDLTPLHLLSLLVLDYLSRNKNYYYRYVTPNKSIFLIGIIGILIFSNIYMGKEGRFAYLGVGDVNISGMGIFLLGAIAYRKYKKIAFLLWGAGAFTFSRNYYLALAIFFSIDYLLGNINEKWQTKLIKLFSFANLAIFSCFVLICLSLLYQKLYDAGALIDIDANAEFGRMMVFFDYSNYHRFTVNTNLIDIYIKRPNLLLSGMSNREFFEYNFEICKYNGNDFSFNIPHNFYFSYLQLYGIYSFAIFFFMQRIFKNLIIAKNFHLFLAMMSFGVFLGMGLSGYWLGLFIIAMIIYSV